MEQVKKVISQAEVHKPSKTFKKSRLFSEVICEAFRSFVMAYLLVACKTGQGSFACTLPSSTTSAVLQAYCLGLGERGGEGLCIT